MKNTALPEQAEEILRQAEAAGVQSNFFFITTFKRYQVQLSILEELEKSLEAEGLIVKKTYVKGKSNIYGHPAIAEYNHTTDSANKTAAVLMKLIKAFDISGGGSDQEDIVKSIINGGA